MKALVPTAGIIAHCRLEEVAALSWRVGHVADAFPWSSGMTPSLFIVSVYRPDLYSAALEAVGFARDVEVVLDRRVGDRRRPGRELIESADINERRRLRIEEQLRADGWALVSPDERSEARSAAHG